MRLQLVRPAKHAALVEWPLTTPLAEWEIPGMRLHLAGFYWGDCSLSNTLFRRDADALQAYIIDVETGERHPTLSAGQRRHDLQIATANVAGDLVDLQVGGLLSEGIDPIETAIAIEASYDRLWAELTVIEEFKADETFRVDQPLRRPHDLGFDAAELELVSKLEPAELYHQVLEHRWFLSEAAGSDVGLAETIEAYVRDVLAPAPDEHFTLAPPPTQEIPVVADSVGPDAVVADSGEMPVNGTWPLSSPP